MAMLAKERGLAGVIVPRENAAEAAVVGFLTEQLPLGATVIDLDAAFAEASQYEEDFNEVRGQESVKRALVVAAAGGHNILTLGPSARYDPN